jgi:hypothetical protein
VSCIERRFPAHWRSVGAAISALDQKQLRTASILLHRSNGKGLKVMGRATTAERGFWFFLDPA